MDYTKKEGKTWAREKLVGQWTTMITPFNEDDLVDEEGLQRNIDHVAMLGTEGMGFSWNMGEFWSLTNDERARLMEIVPDMVKGRTKIAFQVTETSYKDIITMANKAEELGYDFVILGPPYMMAKTEEHVINFVQKVADGINVGIAFYNSPQFNILMSAKGLSRLADITNLIAIKEASFNMQLGIDTHLLAGEKAVVSVPDEEIFFFEPYYNFHQQVMFANTSDWRFDTEDKHDYVNYINLATKSEHEKAKELYKKIEPIKKISRKWWSQTAARSGGALPVSMAKYWGELMGMAGGRVRLPLINLTQQEKDEMKSELAKVGLIKQEVSLQ